MFESVGFLELAIIFVVALVVLGPNRLPGLVRKIGRWIGKARSMARDFQQQLENEVNLDELNRMTEKQARTAPATPPVPPEMSGQPPPEAAAPEAGPQDAAPSMADSGYPYGAPDTGAAPAEAARPPDDDTYSHAHAQGEVQQPWSPDGADADAKDKPAA